MTSDHLHKLLVEREMLNPRPRNWRMVAALSLLLVIALAALIGAR